VKPFRGKPEKPERSMGEIQPRRGCPASVGRATGGPRDRPPASRRTAPYACTSPLVGRRDPLGVGLRPSVEPARAVRAARSDPRSPGRLARRYRWTRGRDLGSRPVRRKRSRFFEVRTRSGPEAASLLATNTSGRPLSRAPFGVCETCPSYARGTIVCPRRYSFG
jgi:hypothetical protein